MEVANELMVRGLVVGVFQENCWVIGNRRTGEAICIDPGERSDELNGYIRGNGLELQAFALTHGHLDHVGGTSALFAAFPEASLKAPIPQKRSMNLKALSGMQPTRSRSVTCWRV